MAIATRTSRQQRKNAAIAIASLAVFVVVALGVVALIEDICGTNVGAVSSTESGSSSVDTQETELYTPNASEPFYVLLIGSDSRKGTALYTGRASEHSQVDQHSDIMTLVRVDTATHTITLVTIPRDTRMPGNTNKINDALLTNDPEQVTAAVSELTGVQVTGYIMTDFLTFPQLINDLGGVTVDVYQDVTVNDPATGKNITVTAGTNKTLDGDEALALSRARKQYDDNQDAYRQVNVRNIEGAIINKVLDMEDFDVVRVAAGYLQNDCTSNVDYAALVPIVTDFVANQERVTIYSCTGPYTGDYRESDGLWVVDDNPDAWAQLMAAVNAGEDPSGIVEAPEF